MGTISSKELLKLWRLEKLTIEIAIDHIIQNLINIQKTVDVTNTDIFTLRADLDELAQHADIKLGSKDNEKSQRAN
jgi:hypothetical protein